MGSPGKQSGQLHLSLCLPGGEIAGFWLPGNTHAMSHIFGRRPKAFTDSSCLIGGVVLGGVEVYDTTEMCVSVGSSMEANKKCEE